VSDQQIHTENLFKIFGADASDHSPPARTFKRYFPNSLTVLRMGLAFAFPAMPQDWWLWVLAVAALTEWLDGALSRLWSVESQFGRMLDPVADKLFIVAMLFTFVWQGWLSLPILGLVALRDVTVAVACIFILLFGDRSELKRMGPRIVGKLTTALQFAFLLTLLIWREVPTWLTVLTIAFSAVAAVDYIQFYFRHIRGNPDPTSAETND
jgi:phosphatidylglycerophosphate synthase